MENTYWNEQGKHQAFLAQAEDRYPSYGYTSNIYLNMLICMSHLYYDAYNNGGGNIKDCYRGDFWRYVTPYLSDIDIYDFIHCREAQMEQAMDKVLDYLQDKPLDFTVYTVWWSYKDRCLSLVEPTAPDGREWGPVTFGIPEEKERWCQRTLREGAKDITQEVQSRNPEPTKPLPDLCYTVVKTTGELAILKNGQSGYFPCSFSTNDTEANKAIANHYNEKLGVSPAQAKAMEFGSMFGWDKPGANPAVYEKKTLEDKIAGAEAKANNPSQPIPQREDPQPQR